jgi:hypothetical protein
VIGERSDARKGLVAKNLGGETAVNPDAVSRPPSPLAHAVCVFRHEWRSNRDLTLLTCSCRAIFAGGGSCGRREVFNSATGAHALQLCTCSLWVSWCRSSTALVASVYSLSRSSWKGLAKDILSIPLHTLRKRCLVLQICNQYMVAGTSHESTFVASLSMSSSPETPSGTPAFEDVTGALDNERTPERVMQSLNDVGLGPGFCIPRGEPAPRLSEFL